MFGELLSNNSLKDLILVRNYANNLESGQRRVIVLSSSHSLDNSVYEERHHYFFDGLGEAEPRIIAYFVGERIRQNDHHAIVGQDTRC